MYRFAILMPTDTHKRATFSFKCKAFAVIFKKQNYKFSIFSNQELNMDA